MDSLLLAVLLFPWMGRGTQPSLGTHCKTDPIGAVAINQLNVGAVGGDTYRYVILTSQWNKGCLPCLQVLQSAHMYSYSKPRNTSAIGRFMHKVSTAVFVKLWQGAFSRHLRIYVLSIYQGKITRLSHHGVHVLVCFRYTYLKGLFPPWGYFLFLRPVSYIAHAWIICPWG